MDKLDSESRSTFYVTLFPIRFQLFNGGHELGDALIGRFRLFSCIDSLCMFLLVHHNRPRITLVFPIPVTEVLLRR